MVYIVQVGLCVLVLQLPGNPLGLCNNILHKVAMHQMVLQPNLMEILLTQPNNAEEALQKLNGAVIGKQTVRLSWGRNPANKQFRADYGSQWGGAYYGGQVSDGYG